MKNLLADLGIAGLLPMIVSNCIVTDILQSDLTMFRQQVAIDVLASRVLPHRYFEDVVPAHHGSLVVEPIKKRQNLGSGAIKGERQSLDSLIEQGLTTPRGVINWLIVSNECTRHQQERCWFLKVVRLFVHFDFSS